jgi:hypothetical protein
MKISIEATPHILSVHQKFTMSYHHQAPSIGKDGTRSS